jgi:CBS domain-containing protein
VISTLSEHKISGAPVLNERKELIGIISEQDCLRVVIDSAYHNQPISKHLVKDYMQKKANNRFGGLGCCAGGRYLSEASFRKVSGCERWHSQRSGEQARYSQGCTESKVYDLVDKPGHLKATCMVLLPYASLKMRQGCSKISLLEDQLHFAPVDRLARVLCKGAATYKWKKALFFHSPYHGTSCFFTY